MRETHRTILRITGRTVTGVAVGAVCGFALLSLRFVAANQYPTQRIAMIVVAVTALVGGSVAPVRLWRERPAPDTVPPLPATPALPTMLRETFRSRWVSLRERRVHRASVELREDDADTPVHQPQLQVAPVPDAA